MPGELLSKGHECEPPPHEGLKEDAVWRCDSGHYWRLSRAALRSEYRWVRMSALWASFHGYAPRRGDE